MKAKANSANKRLVASASTVAIAVVLYACGGDSGGNASMDVSKGTVLLNANVVNTRDGSVSPGMSIVIDAGKIQQIIPASTRVAVSGSGQAIDASGKFVVPGYNDMHTHLFDTDLASQALAAKVMVAFGITGIREMRGSADLVQAARQLNADSAAGKVEAPEILLIPGEIIGNPVPLLTAAATTAAGAVAEVQKQKGYGAGFIKVTNANHDASLAILAEAKKQGLDVAGHLSPALSARDSSNAGWKAIEHQGSGMGVLLDCSTQEDSIRATVLTGAGGVTPGLPPTWSANVPNAPLYQRVIDSYDAAKCQAVAQTFVTNSTWHTPTLIRERTMRFVEDNLYRTDPNLKYVSKSVRATWESSAVARLAFPATAIATFHQYFSREQPLSKLMKQSGVKMMAGSDTSSIATWVIPGVSLHQEFALLAEAGLSPLEILQMTTLNGAQFLNREATMGTVEAGKNADLVMPEANPLLDAANLSKIAGVVLKGNYFAKAALEAKKAEVAAAYANAPTPTTVAAQVVPEHSD